MTDLFPPVMILNLLLVFLDLTVKLVGQTIYRRVEILVNGFNKNVFAGKVNGDFGFLLQFVDRQDHVHVDDIIEMARNPLKFPGNVSMDCRSDLKVMTTDLQVHGVAPYQGDGRVSDRRFPLARG